MSTHPLEGIFHPQSIAIVGASGASAGMGSFLASLITHGYRGKIYPVNPKHSEILGMKAYPSIKDIPESFEFVISSIPAREVLKMLDDCSQRGAKYAHIYTARFSETGRREAIELEQAILKKAKELGIRLIGPNCMGVYNPQEGISWEGDFPRESGSVGLASQSGTLAIEIVRSAAMRGIRFSKAISYGNAIDLNESDYLDYFSQDTATKIILMYVEGVKDGKRFLSSLKHAASSKPVIVLKGGRGEAGARAATSHTASLAGSFRIWQTSVTQSGAISVSTADEMTDLAVSFYFLPPIRGSRVGVAVGGGGTSVLAADICGESGLDVVPLPREIREILKAKGVVIWDWISNPADFTIALGDDDNFRSEDFLEMMARNPNFDIIIASVNGPWRMPNNERISLDKYLEPYKKISSTLKPLLALVPDKSPSIDDVADGRWKMACEVATKLIEARIPFYPTMERAAKAVGKLINYYHGKM